MYSYEIMSFPYPHGASPEDIQRETENITILANDMYNAILNASEVSENGVCALSVGAAIYLALRNVQCLLERADEGTDNNRAKTVMRGFVSSLINNDPFAQGTDLAKLYGNMAGSA